MWVAAAGWRQAIRTTSSRPQLPVWPRIVLAPSSKSPGSNWSRRCSRIDLAPAGERPRHLADVALGVMTLAQGEQLEELATQVLVGLGLGAVQPVEPAAHGAVAEHPAMQLG